MSSLPDDPTEVLGEDDEEPTSHLEPDTGETEEMRDDSPPNDESRQRGIAMLAASILAALILVGVYIAAGGTDYKPSGAADPCDSREWTDPGNLEEAAQQFALSATDGAACDLGVSREELTRALADDASRQAFMDEQDLSDAEIEEAVRAGLNRAIDDAENAGVIDGLAVTGLRAAVRFMPVDQMIALIQDASEIFDGQDTSDLGGLIEGAVDSFGGDSDGTTGTTGDTGETRDLIPDELGNQIEKGIRDQLPPEIERNLPDDLQKRAEQGLNQLVNP
ncbi:MAG: hypothetical protein JJE13_10075 [Thermoleophilia bacterium]|nr:hypothetical protein [Thermoleophilia bacterium]